MSYKIGDQIVINPNSTKTYHALKEIQNCDGYLTVEDIYQCNNLVPCQSEGCVTMLSYQFAGCSHYWCCIDENTRKILLQKPKRFKLR